MTIFPRSALLFAACLVPIAASLPAVAQDTRTLGTYRDWSAFAYRDDATRVCYIGSEPTESRGDYTQRGDIWILVTHRSPGGSRDVVSIVAGYDYDEKAPVRVAIGDDEFRLFAHGDTAWAYTDGDDRALVDAMKAGVAMTVRGRSRRGTDTTDEFSLLGFTAAHETINQACAD